ncbi:hypothetical protein C9374_001711 [Naegleria lovaniensis]|uniref:Enhancer of rudimentary homolog n=1 Tax=Naegleria lovaniensis TaxID=51637 RepID=A0AA88GXA2_NAELO|nr:uncharacterized protein C9374_001711 [Naegleria lovaniensis]KAG2387379.1 hypothetical protein C9374_001711 [Naegleria lovaniensis]
MSKGHSILLVQFEKSAQSRTYFDYESVSEMADGVCKLFERSLKKINSSKSKVQYSVADLHDWIDRLTDITCLTFKDSAYVPHDRDWIKKTVYTHLKKTVEKANKSNN